MPAIKIFRSRKALEGDKPCVVLDAEEARRVEVAEYIESGSANSYCFKVQIDDKAFSFCYGKIHNRDERLSRLILGIRMAQEYSTPLTNILLY